MWEMKSKVPQRRLRSIPISAQELAQELVQESAKHSDQRPAGGAAPAHHPRPAGDQEIIVSRLWRFSPWVLVVLATAPLAPAAGQKSRRRQIRLADILGSVLQLPPQPARASEQRQHQLLARALYDRLRHGFDHVRLPVRRRRGAGDPAAEAATQSDRSGRRHHHDERHACRGSVPGCQACAAGRGAQGISAHADRAGIGQGPSRLGHGRDQAAGRAPGAGTAAARGIRGIRSASAARLVVRLGLLLGLLRALRLDRFRLEEGLRRCGCLRGCFLGLVAGDGDVLAALEPLGLVGTARDRDD